MAYKNFLVKDHNVSTSTPITPTGVSRVMSDTANKKILTELDISNTSDTDPVIVEVAIHDGVDYYYIVKNLRIPVGTALKIVNNQKIVLMDGQSVHVRINDSGLAVDILGSYLDDVE